MSKWILLIQLSTVNRKIHQAKEPQLGVRTAYTLDGGGGGIRITAGSRA